MSTQNNQNCCVPCCARKCGCCCCNQPPKKTWHEEYAEAISELIHKDDDTVISVAEAMLDPEPEETSQQTKSLHEKAQKARERLLLFLLSPLGR